MTNRGDFFENKRVKEYRTTNYDKSDYKVKYFPNLSSNKTVRFETPGSPMEAVLIRTQEIQNYLAGFMLVITFLLIFGLVGTKLMRESPFRKFSIFDTFKRRNNQQGMHSASHSNVPSTRTSSLASPRWAR